MLNSNSPFLVTNRYKLYNLLCLRFFLLRSTHQLFGQIQYDSLVGIIQIDQLGVDFLYQ